MSDKTKIRTCFIKFLKGTEDERAQERQGCNRDRKRRNVKGEFVVPVAADGGDYTSSQTLQQWAYRSSQTLQQWARDRVSSYSEHWRVSRALELLKPVMAKNIAPEIRAN